MSARRSSRIAARRGLPTHADTPDLSSEDESYLPDIDPELSDVGEKSSVGAPQPVSGGVDIDQMVYDATASAAAVAAATTATDGATKAFQDGLNAQTQSGRREPDLFTL